MPGHSRQCPRMPRKWRSHGTGTGRRKTARVRAPGEPPRERAFPCCPVCGSRLGSIAWLRRALGSSRRWGYVLAYPGRRQIVKVADLWVRDTSPERARGCLDAELVDVLAALMVSTVRDMGVAGWRPKDLEQLAAVLMLQGFFARLTQAVAAANPEPPVLVGRGRPARSVSEGADITFSAPKPAPSVVQLETYGPTIRVTGRRVRAIRDE